MVHGNKHFKMCVLVLAISLERLQLLGISVSSYAKLGALD